MTGPEGNSEFCFPRISMFPQDEFSGNKIHCSPWDQSLSVKYLIVNGDYVGVSILILACTHS